MQKRIISIVVIIVGMIAILAVVLIPRLIKRNRVTMPDYWPTQGWRTSTPEEQGFDSAKLAEALRTIHEQGINMDSLLVIRNGSVILDAYFYPYDGSLPHDLASVTKSVMTTLIGIAEDQGIIQLDQPIVKYFGDRTIANLDARKERITIRHLAGMMNGFESGCLSGDEATLDAMRATADWVQTTLDRKMAQKPGTGFCYDSPGMHLLSAILQEATGMTTLDYARQYLFEPLGIYDVVWESDPQGYTHGWGDLHLKPGDLAKIGYLWLNNGVWDGKQIVSADWVDNAIKPKVNADIDQYGYGWWVSTNVYYAMGRGGQTMRVFPLSNSIIVATGSNLVFEQYFPYLLAALIDQDNALSPTSEGAAQLREALEAITLPSGAETTIPTPELAGIVTGQMYKLEPNPILADSLRIDFDASSQARMQIKLVDRDIPIEGSIGLAGKFLPASNGWGLRGYWTDPHTFVFEIFDIGIIRCQLSYKDNSLELEVLGKRIEGRVIDR